MPGDNIFAQLNWKSGIGTFSGYAYQIDQRATAESQFRLLNQVYGARFTGSRRIDGAAMLAYFKPLMIWLQQQNKGQRCGW